MTKTYVRRSAEERREQAKAIHATLASQVTALRSSDEWKRFLAFAGSFHNYSFNNVMLILAQCPTATRVAGFKQWIDKGRVVRKGERSIKIFGYSTRKVEVEDADGNVSEGRRAFFPILSVFDIAQTEPMPGYDDPMTITSVLTGQGPDGVFDAMSAYLENLGWTISLEPIPGAANGYTTTDGTKRVVISDELDQAQATKTLLHEAAHVTLHADQIEHKEYVEHRGVYECEAESVAYVLAGMVGFDTSAYSVGYVTGWTDDDKVLKETAENVMKAVAVLAPVILPDEE